jgi:hypothetical protein
MLAYKQQDEKETISPHVILIMRLISTIQNILQSFLYSSNKRTKTSEAIWQ